MCTNLKQTSGVMYETGVDPGIFCQCGHIGKSHANKRKYGPQDVVLGGGAIALCWIRTCQTGI